jgi:hypothetical protein
MKNKKSIKIFPMNAFNEDIQSNYESESSEGGRKTYYKKKILYKINLKLICLHS